MKQSRIFLWYFRAHEQHTKESSTNSNVTRILKLYHLSSELCCVCHIITFVVCLGILWQKFNCILSKSIIWTWNIKFISITKQKIPQLQDRLTIPYSATHVNIARHCWSTPATMYSYRLSKHNVEREDWVTVLMHFANSTLLYSSNTHFLALKV